MKGLIHIYTGNGKGKTTAALGLSMRALGHEFRVYIIQFMKEGYPYGELVVLQKLGIEIERFGRGHFIRDKPSTKDVELAEKALERAREVLKSQMYDLVILDEINVAIHFGLLSKEEVLELLREKPDATELVLTGRFAPKELIEVADYVTEMVEVKHPYRKGMKARDGIER
ncbi:MAG: cob(I)yrinic acid a,c-diamide adenosyltransferase [Candidatus Methanofastidiosia archaeon]